MNNIIDTIFTCTTSDDVFKVEITKDFDPSLWVHFYDFKIYLKNDKGETYHKRIQIQTELLYKNPKEVSDFICENLNHDDPTKLFENKEETK